MGADEESPRGPIASWVAARVADHRVTDYASALERALLGSSNRREPRDREEDYALDSALEQQGRVVWPDHESWGEAVYEVVTELEDGVRSVLHRSERPRLEADKRLRYIRTLIDD